jgi:hypothetical protein
MHIISLNWRSRHFFALACNSPPPKMFTFSQRFFFLIIFLTWNQMIYFTVLRMTTMELEASLYPLASDNISSIMSHSAKSHHENVGTRRRKVKNHNKTRFKTLLGTSFFYSFRFNKKRKKEPKHKVSVGGKKGTQTCRVRVWLCGSRSLMFIGSCRRLRECF